MRRISGKNDSVGKRVFPAIKGLPENFDQYKIVITTKMNGEGEVALHHHPGDTW